MRLAPTDGRPTFAMRWWPDALAEFDYFGSLLVVAPRLNEGAEQHHLAAPDLHFIPSLLLRRIDWQGDPETLRLEGWRRKQVAARLALDDPCVPRVYELGLREGQVFELSDYVFGVDLRAVEAAGLRLPWIVAASLFRELLQTLSKMRAAGCLPHRVLRARNLRFSLERATAALRICCNGPLPANEAEATEARRPSAAREPAHGAQLRALIELLLSISSPADQTQRALLLDESHEAADVLADHMQISNLPLDPMSVAKIQFGSKTSLRWLEKSVAQGQHELLAASVDDAKELETFWAGVFELAREDRAVFEGRPVTTSR